MRETHQVSFARKSFYFHNTFHLFMSVRKKITEPNSVFFITFTYARWLHLFRLTNGYKAVYKWFDHLKAQGHCIGGM
ncbi:MAG: hypothetical protein ABIS69_10755 [Sediminibacterium sp.]